MLDSEPRGHGFEPFPATDLVPLGKALYTMFLTSLRNLTPTALEVPSSSEKNPPFKILATGMDGIRTPYRTLETQTQPVTLGLCPAYGVAPRGLKQQAAHICSGQFVGNPFEVTEVRREIVSGRRDKIYRQLLLVKSAVSRSYRKDYRGWGGSIVVGAGFLRGCRSFSPPDSARFPVRFCTHIVGVTNSWRSKLLQVYVTPIPGGLLSWAGGKLLEPRRQAAPTTIDWIQGFDK
ncbi:hypothetical protein Bbelb_360270 [Branchiostoma belcheri]|nr:hypothetical protein Bbelb_360270 [Branchiostoma belcheri]